MLPALKTDGLSLADVMKSCLDSIRQEPNRLTLPPVDNAVVVLVDGLGAEMLKARSGHARTMSSAFTAKAVIESGFPTTTAAALASLTTGVCPGQHGLVGYTVLDPEHDRVVNQLSGWDDRLNPATWQLVPTLFETAVAEGFEALAIGPERYMDSGFTRAVLRGARYVPAATIAERLDRAAIELKRPGRRLVYVYVPELDQAAHGHGRDSDEWLNAFETTDAAVRSLTEALGPRDGVLVTADHGIVDIPQHSQVLVPHGPLLDGVRFIAGEPRCLQLHLEPGTDLTALAERWRESEGDRAWVLTRDEAVAAGWFGTVRPEVLPRIGDLLVAARKAVAYYDGRLANPPGRSMVGQHGSWSPAELRVPLLRFGAFAR
ncbi:MAG: alkaline phosphatase family protein [Salinibacterium sp.]|nr:alkaline phosphatase family protein [Salinibacterium sp.]